MEEVKMAKVKGKTKKVEGSPGVKEVLTDGLREARKGTDQGYGKSKPLQNKIPNIESRTPKEAAPRKLSKPEYGDIVVQVHGEKEAKKFFEEN